MTADILPQDLAAQFRPEWVSPVVGWFCASECVDSGTVIEAGGGYFAKVAAMEGLGTLLGDDAAIAPEDIRDNWNTITDMRGAREFSNSLSVIAHVVEKLGRVDERLHS